MLYAIFSRSGMDQGTGLFPLFLLMIDAVLKQFGIVGRGFLLEKLKSGKGNAVEKKYGMWYDIIH